MRYAITGSTGFLGANVCRTLLDAGHDVVALIRKPNRLLDGLDLELSKVPIVDSEDGTIDELVGVLDGCDGLFHVAGVFDPSPGGEERMRAIHVTATQRLADAAAAAGVKRMVLCSSSITVGFGSLDQPGDEDTPLDPSRTYGVKGALRAYHDTKLEAERLVAGRTDIEGVIVNPDFILGAHDVKPTSGQLVVALARRWVPVYPKGGKCFQTASDCGRGHLLAMESGRPGRRYLLGSHNLSYQDFMGRVAAVVGRRPPKAAVPGWLTSGAGFVGRLGSRIDAHRFAGLDPHVLRSMQTERYRTDGRARSELGLDPEPIELGIEAAYRWFSDNGYC